MTSANSRKKENESAKAMTEKVTDNMDSLTIHHSDHLSLVLVSKTLEDNYGQWSRTIRIALSYKNKIGFINGTIQSPLPTDSKFPAWQWCNHTMKSLWDKLASYYDPISCNCEGLKALVEREEKERVIQFLMGLNESFATVRGSILMMSPLPDTHKIHALVLQQKRQTNVVARRENTGFAAMQTSKNTHGYNSGPYTMAESSQTQDNGRFTIVGKAKKSCSHCGKDYHTADHCYYLIGFPPGYKLHGKDVKPRRKKPNANNTTTDNDFEAPKPTGNMFTPKEFDQLKTLL
ncbi:hypothetical protein JRO89_XS12G0144300 [Xanthoceras sorbifolium]|uniref:Retrotransposon Copia-like N-terminal domain-containing protein n=1 Tax=Xanthoceras sorbifolium TaxID=99658 RepID=A0ABQ8HCL7_9ROSI|nr:hypothetical protein JRO89_XS12G0144300 [Xanthoceras sorbifolium]